MKKILATALACTLVLGLAACGSDHAETTGPAQTGAGTTAAAAGDGKMESKSTGTGEDVDFPAKNLSGIISFNPGGATDIMARIICPELESIFGKSVVVENKAGASGATATDFVQSQEADGHTILFTSEVCNMWQALGIADIDCLKDLTPLMVFGGSEGVLVTQPDCPYETYEDLIAYALEHPGEVTVASAGLGTNIDAYVEMMKVVHGVELNVVVYGSEGDCRTALLGGEVDFTICNNFTALSYIQDGSFVCKASFGDTPIEGYEGAPLLCEVYERYKDFLPWGSYILCFVHKDTDPSVVAKLENALTAAYNSEAFQEYLTKNGVLGYGLAGDDAAAYIEKSRAIQWYLYYDSGIVDLNPADYGIERP